MNKQEQVVARIVKATGVDPETVVKVLESQVEVLGEAIGRGETAYIFGLGLLKPYYCNGKVGGVCVTFTNHGRQRLGLPKWG